MTLGRVIKISHEDISFQPLNVTKMSKQELLEEYRRRIARAPRYEEGKPYRPYILHDEVSYLDELEIIWGKKWSAQGIGRLKEVLLISPKENEFMPDVLGTGKPNLKVWMEQYQTIVDTYSEEGVLVHQVELPVPLFGPYGFPKYVWAGAEVGPIINGGAILRRFTLTPQHRGWEVLMRKILDALGIPILLTISGKGIAEPSAVWLDDHHFIGQDGWTMNREAIEQMKPVFKAAGAKIIVVSMPGPYDYWEWPLGGATHTDMAMAFPDVGVCVLYPALVSYNFLRFLKKIKYEIIEVPPEDYKTCVYNLVNLGPGRVVCPDGGKQTIKEMEKRGIDVIATPQSEFIKVGGAVHCATGALIREQGPLCEELVKRPVEEIAPELC